MSERLAQAGLPGAITIATNMAGRGTDILLGGNPRGLLHTLLSHFWLRDLVADSPEGAGSLSTHLIWLEWCTSCRVAQPASSL